MMVNKIHQDLDRQHVKARGSRSGLKECSEARAVNPRRVVIETALHGCMLKSFAVCISNLFVDSFGLVFGDYDNVDVNDC